jgi:hypothetical protein
MRRMLLSHVFFLMSVKAGLAAPLPLQDVPEPLRPWVNWALHGHKDVDCPIHSGIAGGGGVCVWPTRLELKLNARSGEFSQQWQVFAEEWLSLPGERDHWPQEVKLDGKPVVVRDSDGIPHVRVPPGTHTVSGVFLWDRLPQGLQIPVATGLVALTLDSNAVDFPQIDGSGKLWLRQETAEQAQIEDRLELKVYRRITDSIPLMVTIQVDLQVSGKQREVTLGQALSPEYIPLSLNSSLPARLEPDGRLRIQVRAGQWSITLIARHTGTALTSIPLPAVTGGQWPEEEIWVFEAQPHLRQVTLDDAQAIDAQQTTLPPEWRSFPTYMMKAGSTLQLTEKKRGDPEPAPDQLTLQRQWWLDFDGRGYTIQDTIAGTMTRGWRLDLPAPGTLGRAAVDGQEQFVTKSDKNDRAGVELRRGYVQLVADSRVEDLRSQVPAVGWDHDFHQASGVLHLPPGWRVLTATGVDSMPGTWLDRWTLMDLFVVFLIAIAVSRLWGRVWGVVALVALALITHESGAPWWMWLHVLIATALLRVLPTGFPRDAAFVYRSVALLMLVIIAGTFMVRQARWGLYPQLEDFGRGKTEEVFMGGTRMSGRVPMSAPMSEEVRSTAQTQMARDESLANLPGTSSMEGLESRGGRFRNMARTMAAGEETAYGYATGAGGVVGKAAQRPAQYDPNAAIQTGPGLPHWQWRTFFVGWNGPVERTQEIRFFLLSPLMNTFLAFVRILLVAALLVCVFDIRYRKGKLSLPPLLNTTTTTILMIFTILATAQPTYAQQPLPSPELLNELRNKLTTKEPPQCGTQCVTSPRLHLEIVGDTLRLRQEIHAMTHTALPLPGQQRHWLPRAVLLDGVPAHALSRTGEHLWIAVPQGQHQVLMEGPLPARDNVELALPMHPFFVQVEASGWEVDGIHENGVADGQLQLRRIQRNATTATLEPGTLPPFVRVERTLQLGLTWGVHTRVLRVSPRGSAAVVTVPLLEGESVTTAGVHVESGKALVNMPPNETEMVWSSVLEPRTQLTLKAPDTTAWTEIWKLDVSPIWRVTPTGIPVIHHSDQSSGLWLPEWRPWPGETVTLQIARPEGVPGQTLTIDRSLLQITPGRRATDVTLQMTLRSSRGGQHSITLPDEATLQSVNINGASQAIRQEGRTVTVPLAPGTQEVNVLWRQANGMTTSYATPQVNLGSSSVNASLQIHMPPDRWILFCHGPQLGPAVLFWSAALVVLLGAVVLGRIPMTPLRTRHWILLGIGFSTVYIKIMLFVVGWLFALELRKRLPANTRPLTFNLVQLALLALTVLALVSLMFIVQRGLMGAPEMRVFGNGSSNLFLHWYQDRAGPVLPQGWVFSLPLWTYRLAMLAWALWLASALIGWLRWGWECFSANGLWRKRQQVVTPAKEENPVPPTSTAQPNEG